MTSHEPARERIARELRGTGAAVTRVGSPLYGALLDGAAGECERGGLVYELLKEPARGGPGSAFALRLMGALHRLVLSGNAPELERFFRVAGDDPSKAWPVALGVIERHVDDVRKTLARPVQTNEVGRSAVLAPGFVTIARKTRLPLRLLEVGSSGGLNLRWDRYRYEGREWRFGPERSRVVFRDMFDGPEPPEAVDVAVAEREGCDPSPVDPTSEEGRLTLMSYVWPDQPGRLERLRAALDIAREVPARVEEAGAVEWLPSRLARRTPGVATVIFHSVVMQYLAERERFVALVGDAGAAVTNDAPLAWLRFEPDDLSTGAGPFRLHLMMWPDGRTRELAEAHPHGPPLHWKP